jgi:hypothetical protein
MKEANNLTIELQHEPQDPMCSGCCGPKLMVNLRSTFGHQGEWYGVRRQIHNSRLGRSSIGIDLTLSKVRQCGIRVFFLFETLA